MRVILIHSLSNHKRIDFTSIIAFFKIRLMHVSQEIVDQIVRKFINNVAGSFSLELNQVWTYIHLALALYDWKIFWLLLEHFIRH